MAATVMPAKHAGRGASGHEEIEDALEIERDFRAGCSFFPVIVLGIFWKRATKEAGIAGMLAGIGFTAAYIIYFKFVNPGANTAENWLWGISPEGIGSIGMVINFAVMLVVTPMTSAPPAEVQANIEAIRSPRVERLA